MVTSHPFYGVYRVYHTNGPKFPKAITLQFNLIFPIDYLKIRQTYAINKLRTKAYEHHKNDPEYSHVIPIEVHGNKEDAYTHANKINQSEQNTQTHPNG
jgi:hypothetical protein